jgi:hypothetical protein
MRHARRRRLALARILREPPERRRIVEARLRLVAEVLEAGVQPDVAPPRPFHLVLEVVGALMRASGPLQEALPHCVTKRARPRLFPGSAKLALPSPIRNPQL